MRTAMMSGVSWRIVLTGPLLLALALAVACSSKSSTPPVPTSARASTQSPASTQAPTSTATPAGTSLTGLSLVYVDTSKGQGGEVYVAAYDGANPRRVTTLAKGTFILDVRGNTLVAGLQKELDLVDLKTGAVRTVQSASTISFGNFVDDKTFVFTTRSSCGPPDGNSVTLTKLDTTTLQQTEVARPASTNLGIAGIGPTQGLVALVLRGCDVGVSSIPIYNLADGKLASTITTRGCGQAGVAVAAKKALVALRACTEPPEHANNDYILIDYAPATPVSRDIKLPTGQTNDRNFIFRPGQAQAALGGQMPGTPGPGTNIVSTGLWLVDLNSGAFSNLTAGDGPEQWPIAWSPDGRYILAATTRAQGNCDYRYVDATTKEEKPIAKDFTFCGTNGDVLGWTAIK